MNRKSSMLFIGSISMIALGLIGQEHSYVADGLVLMWIGITAINF
jgi:hypothetical protein